MAVGAETQMTGKGIRSFRNIGSREPQHFTDVDFLRRSPGVPAAAQSDQNPGSNRGMQGIQDGTIYRNCTVRNVLSGGLFQKIAVLPEKGRHTENGFLRMIRDFLHRRDQSMPYEIARIIGVGIGRVGHIGNAVVRTPPADVRTGIGNQRTQKPAVPQGINAAQSAESASAKEVEQNRFELIVGIVRRSDECAAVLSGEFVKKRVAYLARGFLQSPSRLTGKLRNVFAPDYQWNSERFAGFAAERFVPVGVVPADAVIDVRREKPDVILRTPMREMIKQTGGVRTAGIGGDHASGTAHRLCKAETGEGIVKFQGVIQTADLLPFL